MRLDVSRTERHHRLQLIFAFGVLQLIASWIVLLFITQNAAFLHPLVISVGAVHVWTFPIRSPSLSKAVRTVAAVCAVVGILLSLGVIVAVVGLDESLFDAALLGLMALLLLMSNILGMYNGRARPDRLVDRSVPRGTMKG